MHLTPSSLWKTDAARFVVVLDAELQYDHAVHARYLASERVIPTDAETLPLRDPRVTPRWPCHRITALSWLVMTEAADGLRPVRLETLGVPEHDEAATVAGFFADMDGLGGIVRLVTWGGFHNDLPSILLAAATAGLRLPKCLLGLHAPWRREASGHMDLASEVSGGANPPHLAEVAAKLGIPAKLTCRPDLVSKLMELGKWSSVKAVAEGDVLTTAMALMMWSHLRGGSISVLEATRRLTNFIAEHCGHRPYCTDWQRFGDNVLRDAFATEREKAAVIAPHLVN